MLLQFIARHLVSNALRLEISLYNLSLLPKKLLLVLHEMKHWINNLCLLIVLQLWRSFTKRNLCFCDHAFQVI